MQSNRSSSDRAPLEARHWEYIATNLWLNVFAAGVGITIAAVIATMAGDVTLLITLPAAMGGIRLAGYAWRRAMGDAPAVAMARVTRAAGTGSIGAR